MRRLSVAGALVLAVVLGFAGSAQGCSCAPVAPGEALRESDAAVVGRLVDVVPRGQLQADYRYEVQRVYRGAKAIEAGGMLAVRSAQSGAACGLPGRAGRRYGLFLTRFGGRWRAGLCSVVTPRRLWLAAQGRPLGARPDCGDGGTSPPPT
ncbi:MAG TPA: hypothetical protein VNO20_00330 [Solirubrobacterales bacterium]|nr:hypothetical protein [Solirubrobacterales bacterium]